MPTIKPHLNSVFVPAKGLSNRHLQTLLPKLYFSTIPQAFLCETIELDDGDFIDLSLTAIPAKQQPIILIFHGLEGSIESPYAHKLMRAVQARGWCGVLMHFRGCSGRQNRLARSYHSGETDDAKTVITYLMQQYPESDIAAVGFSLGGNMLLKLQGEWAGETPLCATISICAPLKLADSASSLNHGFAKYYQMYLLHSLKQKIKDKFHQHNYAERLGLSIEQIDQMKSFWEFDDQITAPLHGFKGVNDYYNRCSAFNFLQTIHSPTLILHALDDPFMSPAMVPSAKDISTSVELELSQYGGHVGFISGTFSSPAFWLGERVCEYLQEFLPA